MKSDYIKAQAQQLSTRIDAILRDIEVLPDSTISLRFHELDYDLIARLQRDHRVDRSRTPHSRSSIKVVLGTLGYLSRCGSERESEPFGRDVGNPFDPKNFRRFMPAHIREKIS